MSGPAAQIAALNDAMRRAGPLPASKGDQWITTAGVMSKGTDFMLAALKAVMLFDSFTADNDPHGEHDFGAFEVGGERLFWKIDYYDLALEYGSPDPADAAVTRRVLTVMLASEY